MSTRHKRHISAIHEAGHAAVAAWYEWPIRHAELLSDGELGGQVLYPEGFMAPETEALVVGLAGSVAEAKYTKQGFYRVLFRGGHGDLMDLEKLAHGDEFILDLIEDQLPLTRHLVSLNWAPILAAANGLLATGKLDGQELLDLMNPEPLIYKACDRQPLTRAFRAGL